MMLFDEALLQSELKAKGLQPCLFFESLTSTSTYLKQLAVNPDIPEGTSVIAARQTSGKGRLGRQFTSPIGGLYLSYLIRPHEVGDYYSFAPFASLIVYRVLKKYSDDLTVKWPNDILLKGKKISGILVETNAYNDILVVGIGINVSTVKEDFPPELRPIATSLREEGIETSLNAIALELIASNALYLEEYRSDRHKLFTEYEQTLSYSGKSLTVIQNGERQRGIFQKLNADGSIVILTPKGEKHITWGEVSLKEE